LEKLHDVLKRSSILNAFNILGNQLNRERVKMLKYIYQSLMFFRKAFSESFTWVMFCKANLTLFVVTVTNHGAIIIDV